MKTKTPSLTIVIPTRERCDTLNATLKSCVHQQLEQLTILVVDNFSGDMTKSVVASFQDPRIRYINTGRRLAMSVNWEFALSHVHSDYVMFLGDDDAVLPNATSEMMNLVDEHPGVDAISWPSVEYGWPSCQIADFRDRLVIPLTRGLERRSARSDLLDVIKFRRPYSKLPFLYKGLVRADVIRQLRLASGGKVFHSRIPDVYFGIAACAVVDEYLFSSRPLTLNGASAHSNGTSSFAGPEAKDAERKFLSEDNIPFHPSLLFCPSIPILVVESLIQARERLPALAAYQPDLDVMVRAALTQARNAPPNVFAAVMGALAHVAIKNSLSEESARAIASAVNCPFQAVATVYGIDVFNKRCLLDSKRFAVDDCFSAALLADSICRIHDSKMMCSASVLYNSLALLIRQLAKRSELFGRATGMRRSVHP